MGTGGEKRAQEAVGGIGRREELNQLIRKIMPGRIQELDDEEDELDSVLGGTEISSEEVLEEYTNRVTAYETGRGNSFKDPKEIAARFAFMRVAARNLEVELSPISTGEYWNGDDSFFDYIPNAADILRQAANYNPDSISAF